MQTSVSHPLERRASRGANHKLVTTEVQSVTTEVQSKCYLTASTARESTMQVPQGKATVPLLPAHLRCTHLPLKCPQGDRPQDEARQSGASTVEDRAASSSWGLLAPAASPYTGAATVAYITAIEAQASVLVFKSGPSSKWNTHTHSYCNTIPLRTSTVCIYVLVLRIHRGGCDRTSIV